MLLHLLPFVVSEIIAYSTKIPFTFENFFDLDAHFAFRLGFSIATIISWLVYLPLSIRLLHRYRRNLQNEKSNIDRGQNLNWLMFVSIFYIIYSIIAGILGFTFVFLGVGAELVTSYNYVVLLLFIYIISFYGIYQIRIETQTEPEEEIEVISYKNSMLTQETKSKIKNKILAYFESENPYLNPNLNMDLLSDALNFPKYQLTEVLNTEIGKNFFQFVNSYRIEAVKKKLLEPKLKYSIEAIGYECGFNSKSSFYTVFKNLTGETPVTYRKKNIGKIS
jgi:AraC-like DNA-binding protein